MVVLVVALALVVVVAAALVATRRAARRRSIADVVADAADPVRARPLDGALPDHLAPILGELERLGLRPAAQRTILQERSGLTLVQVLAVEPDGRWWIEATGSADPAHPPPLWQVCSLLSGGDAVLMTATRHRLPVAPAELAQTLPKAAPAGLVTAHRRGLALLANRALTPGLVRPADAAAAADRAHLLRTEPCRDDPAGTVRRVLANERDDRDEAAGPLTQQPDLGVRLAALHAR